MNKYDCISNWLLNYKPSFNWIYFNVTPMIPGDITLNSVPNTRELNTYIDGSREVELLFALDLIKSYDTGTSDINLQAIQEYENIAKWVEEQNRLKVFPEFGDNIVVETVEVLETNPSVSIDTNQGLAKYQSQFKITYLEESEE